MAEIDLQQTVKDFVLAWGPDPGAYPNHASYIKGIEVFVKHLRYIMNLYAQEAINHGAIPEKNIPHGEEND